MNLWFSHLFPLAFISGLLYLLWKFVKHIYEVATSPSSIHYVDNKPREVKISTTFCNPFYFDVDYTKASFSGVECILKCDGVCYVQALWGVPIYSLVEYLHKDWTELIKLVTDFEAPEKFSSKCVHASRPFVLADNVERIIDFQLPLNFDQSLLSDQAGHSRLIYPFVVLMVLTQRGDDLKYPNPYVIASANAVHLSDNVLNKSQPIVQFIRLSSGHVGQVKKIYHSSPDEDVKFHLCLICYQKPATVVPLSCSHFCLCRSCYQKCDKCPICRNTYMDFFELPLPSI